mmetsp:Transcript_38559/g.97077  ORF Transcript_38559/g.97077 Transcript_38559/m.97077 type:complete len:222 (-) Transcript_38559:110-775(-)
MQHDVHNVDAAHKRVLGRAEHGHGVDVVVSQPFESNIQAVVRRYKVQLGRRHQRADGGLLQVLLRVGDALGHSPNVGVLASAIHRRPELPCVVQFDHIDGAVCVVDAVLADGAHEQALQLGQALAPKHKDVHRLFVHSLADHLARVANAQDGVVLHLAARGLVAVLDQQAPRRLLRLAVEVHHWLRGVAAVKHDVLCHRNDEEVILGGHHRAGRIECDLRI